MINAKKGLHIQEIQMALAHAEINNDNENNPVPQEEELEENVT
jgi:hypothetical protein